MKTRAKPIRTAAQATYLLLVAALITYTATTTAQRATTTPTQPHIDWAHIEETR